MPSLALGIDVPNMGVPMNAAVFELADASKYGTPQRPVPDMGMDARSDQCINGLLFGHLTLELSGGEAVRLGRIVMRHYQSRHHGFLLVGTDAVAGL